MTFSSFCSIILPERHEEVDLVHDKKDTHCFPGQVAQYCSHSQSEFVQRRTHCHDWSFSSFHPGECMAQDGGCACSQCPKTNNIRRKWSKLYRKNRSWNCNLIESFIYRYISIFFFFFKYCIFYIFKSFWKKYFSQNTDECETRKGRAMLWNAFLHFLIFVIYCCCCCFYCVATIDLPEQCCKSTLGGHGLEPRHCVHFQPAFPQVCSDWVSVLHGWGPEEQVCIHYFAYT